MVVAAGFVILGGLMSLAGIVNPEREVRERHVSDDEPGPVRIHQPCPEARRAA